MNHIERRDAGLVYISDQAVFEEQKGCRRRLQRLNRIDMNDFEGIGEAVKALLGSSDGAFINSPSTVTTAATFTWAGISLPTTTAPSSMWPL